MEKLLSSAVPNPTPSVSNGGALSLALSCFMIEPGGFELLDQNGKGQGKSNFAPPPSWAAASSTLWTFDFIKGGALFRLSCSLQASTNRMFIHAAEINTNGELVESNIQVLGLQLENYVVPSRLSETNTWEGVISNELALKEMFQMYIMQPLWANARTAGAKSEISTTMNTWKQSAHSYISLASDKATNWTIAAKKLSNANLAYATEKAKVWTESATKALKESSIFLIGRSCEAKAKLAMVEKKQVLLPASIAVGAFAVTVALMYNRSRR